MSLKDKGYEELDVSSPAPLNTDQAIVKAGGSGRYQIISCLIISFIFTMVGRIIYGLPFLQDTQNITIRCVSPEGAVTNCDKPTACDSSLTASYFFDTKEGRTNFITEVPELLCYSDAEIGLQGTTYFIGFTLGSLLWMRLTDFWGRKRMILGGLLLFTLTLVLHIVDLSAAVIYVCLFLFGLQAPLLLLIPFLLMMQLVSPSSRAFTCTFLNAADVLTTAYVPLVYQFGRNWKIMYWLDLGLTLMVFLPFLFFVTQSPKFYVSVNKFGKAREIYKNIAKINKRPLFLNKLEGEERANEDPEKGRSENEIRQLFQIKSLRVSLLVVPFIWFTVSFISYGVFFALGSLVGSIYTNGYLSGGVSLVSYVISGPMANLLGRKKTLIICFLVAGVSCLLYNPLKPFGLAFSYTSLGLFCFGSSCVFNIVFLVTTEAFPTVYRGTVLGFGNLGARVGGILAPLVAGVAKDSFMYIFGGFGVVSGLVSFLLKETKGEVMGDTIGEETKKNDGEAENQANHESQLREQRGLTAT